MASRALPELKARLRLDTSQMKRDVAEAAASTEALGKAGESAGVKSAAGMSTFSKELAKVKAQAIENIALMSRLGSETAKIGSKAGGSLASGSIFGALGSLGSNLPIIGLVTGAIGGLMGGLEELTRRTAEYSTEVLRNSELLGLDTTQYQVLAQASGKLGVSQEDLTLKLGRFQKNLEAGLPTLKAFGLTGKDIGITSGDLGTAINQLSTYLSTNTDVTQRNAVAQALLGRGSLQLTEILSKGPQFLQDYQAHLERFGLILDKTTLQQGALSNAVSSTFHDALKGLEFQVGTQLEGAFIGLESTVIQALGGSKEAFRKIGDVIASVIGFITSFLNGLFGLNIDLASLSSSADKAATDLNAMGAAADTAAGATDALGAGAAHTGDALAALKEATKDQTTALDGLIKAEQEQTKTALAGIDDQKKAISELATVQVAAIDDQITAQHAYETTLNDQFHMAELLQQQSDENGTSVLAMLKAQLDVTNDVNDARRHSGESLIDYERRMEQKKLQDSIKAEENKRASGKTNQQIFLEQVKEQVQAKVSQLDEEKKNLQESTRLQLAALDEQRQGYSDTSTSIIQGYQEQKSALAQTLSDAEQKSSAATTAMTTDFAGAAAAQQAGALQTGAVFDSVFKQIGDKSSETAAQMGKDLRDVFQHPEDLAGLAGKAGAAILGALASGAMSAFGSLSGPEKVIFAATAGAWLGGPAGAILGGLIGAMSAASTPGAPYGAFQPLDSGKGGDLAYDVNGKAISGTDQNGWFTPDNTNLPPFSTAGQSGTQGIRAPYDATAFGQVGASTTPQGMGQQKGAQHRALGGTITAGNTYLVGERGPELRSDLGTGYITPNDQLGGAGGHTINVINNGSVADEYVALRVLDRLEREARRRGLLIGAGRG